MNDSNLYKTRYTTTRKLLKVYPKFLTLIEIKVHIPVKWLDALSTHTCHENERIRNSNAI